MTKKTAKPAAGYTNRRWDAPRGAVAYPMEGEGPAHPAYLDTHTWLWRWNRLADRRCQDADLYAAYDPNACTGQEIEYPQQGQRRMPL